MPNDAVGYSRRALFQRAALLGLLRSIAIVTLFVLALCGTSRADDVGVTVVFTNGDRLTGTIENSDRAQVRFRPHAVRTLGDVLNIKWHGDDLAELDFGPGCLYQEKVNGQSAKLCFQGAVVRPSTDDTLSITTEDGQTFSGIKSLPATQPSEHPTADAMKVAGLRSPPSMRRRAHKTSVAHSPATFILVTLITSSSQRPVRINTTTVQVNPLKPTFSIR